MDRGSDERNVSLWMATTPETHYPTLEGPVTADVVVVGGGITGLTAALLLQGAGASVVVMEARRIATGTTGHTTAKVSVLQGLVHNGLVSTVGEEKARLYADANRAALDQVSRLVDQHGIDCDFRRAAAYTYTEDPASVHDIEDEVEACRKVGLPATFATETPLPFPVRAAVRLDDQALFHPRKYCLALAEVLTKAGGRVYESSRAMQVRKEEDRYQISTEAGLVVAPHAIIATLLPFHDEGALFARSYPSRSYALAVTVRGETPDGMFLSSDTPTRSVRPHPLGGSTLVVEGEEHKTGQDARAATHYEAVEAWARERFQVESVDHRWSAQDYMTPDQVPYVGAMRPGSEHLLVATGFNKWGMTNGTAAALMLTDLVLGRENPWLSLYDAKRIQLNSSVGQLVKENLDVGKHFLGDRLGRSKATPEDLRPGEGAVVDKDGRKLAIYRSESGALQALSATCTHMGCVVSFNDAERTWDCPCHGSRFDLAGEVIEGPAVRRLEPARLGSAAATGDDTPA